MVSKNEKTSSFESGVLQIRRKSNKIDKNEKFLNREFNKSEFENHKIMSDYCSP